MGSLETRREEVKLQKSKQVPEWLTRLLKINFYHDEDSACKNHGKTYKTHFCIDCASEPFCGRCSSEPLCRSKHRVLQIVRCSEKAAIKVDDMKNLVSVIEIQPFVINNNKIVFLQERETKGKRICTTFFKEWETKGIPMCTKCRGRLVESNYKFCSLACQVEAQNEANAVMESRSTGPEGGIPGQVGDQNEANAVIQSHFIGPEAVIACQVKAQNEVNAVMQSRSTGQEAVIACQVGAQTQDEANAVMQSRSTGQEAVIACQVGAQTQNEANAVMQSRSTDQEAVKNPNRKRSRKCRTPVRSPFY